MDIQQSLFCRVTIEDKTPLDVYTALKNKYSKFIVSYEEASNSHFHILIYHEDTNKKNARQNLRNFIKKEFGSSGNGGYAITDTRAGTETTLAKYTIKQGCYLSLGFEESYLKILEKQSYKKFNAKEFKQALQKLRDKYIEDPEMSIQHHIYDILDLKCKQYNQDCNMNLIKNYATTSYIKKSDDNLWTIGHEIYDSIFRHETFIRNTR